MSEELKPCPFCGGEPKVTEREGFAFFWCGECGASSKIAKESEAREYWNRRPAEDALTAEVERLKNDLEIQKNLTRMACFESNRAYDEVEKWKKMFYDLFDKQAKVSTDPKVIVINTDKEKGGEDE